MQNFLRQQITFIGLLLYDNFLVEFLANTVLSIFRWVETENELKLSALRLVVKTLQVAIQRLGDSFADVEAHSVRLLVQIFGALVGSLEEGLEQVEAIHI